MAALLLQFDCSTCFCLSNGINDDANAGNKLMPGAQPHAHAYCGHQFGSFAGQLGDGAAMYLGEVEGPSGRWVVETVL